MSYIDLNIKEFIVAAKFKYMVKMSKILLTGDTPSGKLHLGHYVGSLQNRIKLQDEYESYILIANYHGFTTNAQKHEEIYQSTLDIAIDYFAAGLDPNKACIFLESEVPAIFEMAAMFSMLISYPRLMRNPTLKDEIKDKELGHNYSAGFLYYPILQVADILDFRADLVPVGEDQIPHLEMAREVARKFNFNYCGVPTETKDEDHIKAGGLFPIFQPLLSETKRLVGLGGPNEAGRLLKMSKSLNNSILLSDDNDTIRKKIMGMYTDPNRLRATDPGTIENNPLWIFHDAFNEDKKWLEEAKARYQQGTIGDVECKKKLVDIIVNIIEPISTRRKELEQDPAYIIKLLKEGSAKARSKTATTLKLYKEAIKFAF